MTCAAMSWNTWGAVTTAAGTLRADTVAAGLPRRAWQRLPAGPGSTGPRYYDWAWISFPTDA